MPIQFAMMQGERYKIIIGMDILKQYGATVDTNAEVLKFKLNNGTKVNLKMTPRSTVFKTK